MSLVAFATRLCMYRALQNATYAGDAVENSPVDAVDLAVKAATPVIAIFTDTESTKVDGGRSLFTGTRTMDIILHVFLPSSLKIKVNGSVVPFSARRGGAAMAVDLIWRDITRALMTSDAPFPALWRRLVPRITEVDHKAYVLQVKDGPRIPAREIVLRCETIGDPMFGVNPEDADPDGIWAQLLAALRGDEFLAELEPLIRGAITGPTLAPRWLAERWFMGETIEEDFGLGLGPLDGAPPFRAPGDAPTLLAPAPMVEVTIEREGEGTGLAQQYTIASGNPSSYGI